VALSVPAEITENAPQSAWPGFTTDRNLLDAQFTVTDVLDDWRIERMEI
jgi:hypothetical protein